MPFDAKTCLLRYLTDESGSRGARGPAAGAGRAARSRGAPRGRPPLMMSMIQSISTFVLLKDNGADDDFITVLRRGPRARRRRRPRV